MKTAALAIFLVGLAAFAQPAEPPQLQNVKLVVRETADLQGEVHRIVGEKQPAWIAYALPSAAPEQQMCCFSGSEDNWRSCGCTLERRNGSEFSGTVEGPGVKHLEPRPYFYVFLRANAGDVEKIRTFSAECPIDADGMTVYWLGNPQPAQSVALLSSFITGSDGETHSNRIIDSAIMAIAFTHDRSADAALDKLLAVDQSIAIRKKAAFWTGQLKGKPGLEKLVALMRNDPDDRFRSDLTFDISQSKLPEAQSELIRAAHQDSNSRVRSQALFWLAQKAGSKVAGAITDAIERDPDTDVKKKAVFALTQMPHDEGIPLLIQVAKNNNNAAVRKQAVFWLGQSNDPRALEFIESVLTH